MAFCSICRCSKAMTILHLPFSETVLRIFDWSDTSDQLQNLHSGIRSQHFENLAHIDFGGAVGKAAVPEHSPEGLALGDLLDYGVGDVLVKAGNQVTVVVGVGSAALDFFGDVWHGQGQAPLQQAAEQQIQVSAVGLDVALQLGQHILTVLPGGVVDVGHVGVVQLEHTETAVKGLVRIVGSDFPGGAADALFANFTDIFIPHLVSLGFFVTGFRQLYHDKFPVSAVLGVYLHDGVGGGSGAGEKVKYNIISTCMNIHQKVNQRNWLWKGKHFATK